MVIRSVLSSSDNPAFAGTYRLPDDVVFVRVHDGSGRLIDLSGSASALSRSAAAMLESALRVGIDAAVKDLAARYGVPEGRLREDLLSFLADLERRRQIVIPRSSRPLAKRAARWLAGSIRPLVALCARRSGRITAGKVWMVVTLAYVATRFFGWSHTIAVWDRAIPLRIPKAGDPAREITWLDRIEAAVARVVANHPLEVGCKERALSCWTLARACGIPARIVLGIDLFPFAMHCWCVHGERILADIRDGRCDRFTPILEYR